LENISPPLSDSQTKEKKLPQFNFKTLGEVIYKPRQAFASIVAQPKLNAWMTPVAAIILVIVVAAVIGSFQTSKQNEQNRSRSALMAPTATPTPKAVTSGKTSGSSSGQSQGGPSSGGPGGGGGAPGGGGGNNGGGGGGMPSGGGPGGGGPGGESPGNMPMDNMGDNNNNNNGSTYTRSSTSTIAAALSGNVWVTIISQLIYFLLSWLLVGMLINLLLLAFKGHSNTNLGINMMAWASVPVGIRNLVHIFYFLALGKPITSPGLSGFISTASSSGPLTFVQQFLARIDVYLFWQIALLAIGIEIGGKLVRKKSLLLAILAIVAVLMLQALLGWGIEAITHLNLDTSILMRQ
jgi:hypothetical protein